MTCQDHHDLMMGYLDDELSPDQRKTFELHVQGCPECRTELAEFQNLKKLTESIQWTEPEDRIWQRYWDGVYNRIERGIGWILFSIGGMILCIYGGFKLIENVIREPGTSLVVKAALVALMIGLAILFVSILRERLFIRSRDRYQDVMR